MSEAQPVRRSLHSSAPRLSGAAAGLLYMLAGMLFGAGLYWLDIRVLQLIRAGIRMQDTGYLLASGGAIALLNTLRVLPIYLGAYQLMAAVTPKAASPLRRGIGYAVAVIAVPVSYAVIRLIFGIPYDFGVPAAVALMGIIAVHAVIQKEHGFGSQAIILALFIFGLQWLNLAPGFNRYGFGQGELTQEFKMGIEFLDAAPLARAVTLSTGFILLGISLIMGKSMVDFAMYKAVTEEQRRQQQAMQAARLRDLESRTLREIQALVHDLKTPLTAIRGLVGILDSEKLDPKRRREHIEQIDQAIERMNLMISEILYREPQRVMAGEELIRYISAHLAEYSPRIRVDIGSGLPRVQVNAVRLTRAVANLVQNALEAAEGMDEPIVLRARRVGGNLRIVVRDWGRGTDPSVLQRAVQPGFSTKGSSGMGLYFVRQVVLEDHGGQFAIYGKPGRGTLACITLRGW